MADPTLTSLEAQISNVKAWVIAHALWGVAIAFALGVMVGRFL